MTDTHDSDCGGISGWVGGGMEGWVDVDLAGLCIDGEMVLCVCICTYIMNDGWVCVCMCVNDECVCV